METEKKKSQEISGTDADGMEDISSDSSSATSKYSHLNSSSEEEDERSGKEGETEPNELKPGNASGAHQSFKVGKSLFLFLFFVCRSFRR